MENKNDTQNENKITYVGKNMQEEEAKTDSLKVDDNSTVIQQEKKQELKEGSAEFNTLQMKSEPEIKNLDLLLEGQEFLKYGKWGNPGVRIVRVSKDLSKLEWVHKNETKPSGSIPVSKLVGVKFGRHTSNFQKFKVKSDIQEQLSFTIFGEERNLDLEANMKEQMDLFIEGLTSLIKYQKSKNPEIFKESDSSKKK